MASNLSCANISNRNSHCFLTTVRLPVYQYNRTMSRLFADTPQSVEDELIRRLDLRPAWYRLEMAARLNAAVREMMLAGLRRQYPRDTPEQQRRRLFYLLYDPGVGFPFNQPWEEVLSIPTGPIEIMTTVAGIFDGLGIDYVIGGSMASAYYGISSSTLDVDFVADVRYEHVASLVEIFGHNFYLDELMIRGAIEQQGSFNLIHLSTMFKVDVFIPGTRGFDWLQLQRRVLVAIGPDETQRAYLSTPEDIILAKLDCHHRGGGVLERQWGDILGVLLAQKGRLDLRYLRDNAAKLGLSDSLSRAFTESDTV